MRCETCGGPVDENEYCAACGARGAEPRVHVLTREEQRAYRGVTIEAGHGGGEAGPDVRFERGRRGFCGVSYVRLGGGSWLSRLAVALGAAALAAFILFIALPAALAIAALGAASWFLYRLFQ